MKGFNNYTGVKNSPYSKILFGSWTMQEMKKKEYFAEQGIVTTHAAYVEKGMFRYVCTDENGCEHIVGYAFAGEYVGDYPQCIKRRKQ